MDRKAVDIPGVMNDKPIITPTEKLAKWKGIKYISFYTSPSAFSEKEKLPPPEAKFSEKELILFAKRYEEGYDVFDERYGLWLQKFHPEDDVVHKSLLRKSMIHLLNIQWKYLAGRNLKP